MECPHPSGIVPFLQTGYDGRFESDGSTLPFELRGDDGYALALVVSVKSMYEVGLLSLLDPS